VACGVGLAARRHDPGKLELLGIARVDLVEGAIAVRGQIAVGMDPGSARFGRKLRVADPGLDAAG